MLSTSLPFRLGRLQGVDNDTNTYSTPNANWTVIDSFQSGQVIVMEVVIVYYHWVSHSSVRVCPTASSLPCPDTFLSLFYYGGAVGAALHRCLLAWSALGLETGNTNDVLTPTAHPRAA